MTRQPPAGFAAHDDPRILDRALTAEREEHLDVIAARPRFAPEAAVQVRRLRDRETANAERAAAEERNAREAVASIGPIARRRRHGRQELDNARARLTAATERAEHAEAARRAALAHVDHIDQVAEAHEAWTLEHGWRFERVAEIDRQLDHHWATAVITATRQGDPLAFGVDRLRHARHTTLADLHALEATLPPDQRDHLARAEVDLRHRENNLAHARRSLTTAEQDVEAARERRWGRRDNHAIAIAENRLAGARSQVARSDDDVESARAEMDRQQRAVDRYLQALGRIRPERQRLEHDVKELATVLTETRPERVLAAAHGDPSGRHLDTALGAAPTDPAGRAVWCAIAEEIETHRDHTDVDPNTASRRELAWLLGDRPAYTTEEWDRVARLVNDAPALLHTAASIDHAQDDIDDPRVWRAALDRNRKNLDAARTVLEPEPPGMSRGLDW